MIRRVLRPVEPRAELTYESFLADHLDSLARYARVLTGNRDDAHDALTDCLIKVQHSWQNITTVDQPLAYVRKMLSNTVISSKRRWSHRNIRVTDSGFIPEAGAEDRSAIVDRLDELHRMLRTLTERQRTMVVMRYYLDLAPSDIAAELGCTEVTVRSVISRALSTLRTNPMLVDRADYSSPGPTPPATRSRRLSSFA